MSDVVFSGHVAAGANLNDKIRLEFEVSRYSEFSDKAPRNFNVVMGFYQTYPALDIDTYMLNLYADVYSLENSAAKVFVGAGVGAARVVLGGSTDYDTYGVQPIRKQSERKGTFMLESGVDYPLDDRTSLMVSMRYQYINMRDTFSKSFVGHMDMVTANAGVRVTF
jgi:opacity protein-like surface antigen